MLILFLVFYLQWKYELGVLFIIPIWTNSRKSGVLTHGENTQLGFINHT